MKTWAVHCCCPSHKATYPEKCWRSLQQHMKAGSTTDTAGLVTAAEGYKFGWPLPRVNDGVWRYCSQLRAGAAELFVGSQSPGAVALLLRSVKAAASPCAREALSAPLDVGIDSAGMGTAHIHKLPELLLAPGSVSVCVWWLHSP